MKNKKFKSNVVNWNKNKNATQRILEIQKKTKRKGKIKHEQQIIKIEKQKDKTFVP